MVVSLKHFNYNKQNTFVLAGNNRLPTRPPPPFQKEGKSYITRLKPENKTSPLFLQRPWEGVESRRRLPGTCAGFQSGFDSSGPGPPPVLGDPPCDAPVLRSRRLSPARGLRPHAGRRQVGSELKSFTDEALELLPRRFPSRRSGSCCGRG